MNESLLRGRLQVRILPGSPDYPARGALPPGFAAPRDIFCNETL